MRWLLAAAWTMVAATASAERLPARIYTTADGLANDRVEAVARDDLGYLWFATLDGLSRFDGHEFTTYGVAEGLPSAVTSHVLAASDGTVWVGTDRGVAWLDPRERGVAPRFHALPGPAVNRLLEDGEHRVWAGTSDGLARVSVTGTTPIVLRAGHEPAVLALAYDARDRSLWLGTSWGVVHRRDDGAVEQRAFSPNPFGDDRVFSVVIDRTHRLWLGWVGSRVLAIPLGGALPEGALWDAAPAHSDWLRYEPTGWPRRGILEDSRGTIWIGTTRNLVRYDGARFEELGPERIGVGGALAPCVEDVVGNVWFGSDTDGIARVTPRGLVTYTEADGLDSPVIHGFAQARDGTLFAVTYREGHEIARFDGNRFTSLRPAVPGHTNMGWAWIQPALIDRDGRWWFSTGEGIARFRPGDFAHPDFFGPAEGLPGRDVFRLFEDHRGDVWIATLSATGLARWDRATDRVVALPSVGIVGQFAEDTSGVVWMATDGGLARYRDGVAMTIRDGLPDAALVALTIDAHGRLWIGTDRAGLLRVDDPEHPRVRRYGLADGFASEQVQTVIDDLHGRIYVGTSRGIDRLDPETGDVEHYGRSDGLPNESVIDALRDRDGALWFGTKSGAVRLVPEREPPRIAAPTYITRVSVMGVARPVAFGGELVAPTLELPLSDDQLDIAFTSPSFAAGAPVRFQYRLDNGRWSAPAAERVVHLAKLAAGSYRFEVRAVLASSGVAQAARLALTILPPLYLRWWFIALAALVTAGAGYALYRWRLAHLLAVERVRARIASDLHDEIGSSLSRISILSELASRRAAAHEDVDSQIRVIGTSARELVAVASDIVWATDPRRDDLGALIVRLRTFTADVLESRDIAWTLDAPLDPDRIKLDSERRRHLYLVLKEAIHNAARHSGARRVHIAIKATASGLTAIVRDDGRGFNEQTLARGGNGLENMRARAAEAGGYLDIRHEGGTEITLRL